MNYVIENFQDKFNKNKNIDYFYKNFFIPFNCEYVLSKLPYYENTEYFYRDFNNDNDFKLLITKKINKKPLSRRKFNMGHYYIPDLPKGKIIKYEILPAKVEKYNLMNIPFKIKYILTYSKSVDSFSKNIYLKIGKINKLIKYLKIEFIPFNIINMKNHKLIKWIPIYFPIIQLNQFFVIDFSDFNFKNIDKKILIIFRKSI